MYNKCEVLEYIKNQQLTDALAEEIYNEVFDETPLNSTTGVTEQQLNNLNELIESFTGIPVQSKPILNGSFPLTKPEPEKLEVTDQVNQQTELETAAKGSLRGVELMKLYENFTIKAMIAQSPHVEQNIQNAYALLTSSQSEGVKELSNDRDLINAIISSTVDTSVITPPQKQNPVNGFGVDNLVEQQVKVNSRKVNKENFLKTFNQK